MFEIDDIEDTWTYNYKFDFIHMRMMVGSIDDWPRCFRQCYEWVLGLVSHDIESQTRSWSVTDLYRYLNPGGWIEIKDVKFPIEDNDNSFPKDCAVKKWADLILEGTTKLGRPADSAKYYKEQLIQAGFENVVEIQYVWPQNSWPQNRKLKELGKSDFSFRLYNFS